MLFRRIAVSLGVACATASPNVFADPRQPVQQDFSAELPMERGGKALIYASRAGTRMDLEPSQSSFYFLPSIQRLFFANHRVRQLEEADVSGFDAVDLNRCRGIASRKGASTAEAIRLINVVTNYRTVTAFRTPFLSLGDAKTVRVEQHEGRPVTMFVAAGVMGWFKKSPTEQKIFSGHVWTLDGNIVVSIEGGGQSGDRITYRLKNVNVGPIAPSLLIPPSDYTKTELTIDRDACR
jgi:hypothetical protein